MRMKSKMILAPLVVLALFLLLWEYVPGLVYLPQYILPQFSKVLLVYTDPMTLNLYLKHAIVTLTAAITGLFIGASLGFIAGVLLTESRLLMTTFYPYIVALQCMPKLAIAPLLVIWFGFGLTPKIIIVALLCFFPVLVNTISGIRGVSREYIELFQAIRASRFKTLVHLLIPSALPSILTGVELAILLSLLGAIVGEFVGAQRGLGVQILQMNFAMDIAGTFSVFVILSVMGVGLHQVLQRVKARVLFWAPSETAVRVINA